MLWLTAHQFFIDSQVMSRSIEGCIVAGAIVWAAWLISRRLK